MRNVRVSTSIQASKVVKSNVCSAESSQFTKLPPSRNFSTRRRTLLSFTNSRIDQVSRNIERLSLYFPTQNGNETSPSLFAISREKRDRTRNRNNGEKERKGWLCAGDVLITTDSLPRFIGSFFFFFFFFNGALLPSNGSGHNCVAQLRSTPWREGVHLRATSLPFFPFLFFFLFFLCFLLFHRVPRSSFLGCRVQSAPGLS